jgi:hypothetical protein
MKQLFILIIIGLLPLVPLLAQDEGDDGGEVIMLEEIIIQVAPELPTLVVSIPRQVPDVKPITIQSPIERMSASNIESIKPNLGEMNVSKIEQSKKMLAKPR